MLVTFSVTSPARYSAASCAERGRAKVSVNNDVTSNAGLFDRFGIVSSSGAHIRRKCGSGRARDKTAQTEQGPPD